jgi:diketogulonate reductase-like aldo/keto reductase
MTLNDTSISRRTFVASLAAALAAVWLAPGRLQAANQALIRKTIPASGEALPVIGLGSSRTFDIGSDHAALANLVAVMRAFFANGGQLIDSSPMYGSAEQVIGELLQRSGPQDKLFAATKVWTDGEQRGIRQMEDSLGKWGLESFDLMQIHNLRDWQVHLPTLRDWKETGRIRYIGITTSHGRHHDELARVLGKEPIDFVQLSYNIEDRRVEERLLPLAAERGIAVLVNRPFQRGSLFGKVKGQALPDWAGEIDCASWGQFFLKFTVSHPAVTCAIPATTKVHHMQDNMAAGFGRLPDAAMRQRMIDFYTAL